MTKKELIEELKARGIVADESLTNKELKAMLDAKEGEVVGAGGYVMLVDVKHNGVRYKKGESVSLDEATLAEFLSNGFCALPGKTAEEVIEAAKSGSAEGGVVMALNVKHNGTFFKKGEHVTLGPETLAEFIQNGFVTATDGSSIAPVAPPQEGSEEDESDESDEDSEDGDEGDDDGEGEDGEGDEVA